MPLAENEALSTPLFSVIIPTFNREATIRSTLESIAAQRFQNFECIVIDDGSTDRTCEIVRSFSFVRLVIQQNSGPGSARNHGVKLAVGEYIAFLDSDDLWFPWSLETYACVITENDRPCFVTGRQACFSDEAETGSFRRELLRVERFADYFASSDRWRWFGVSSFVIRRDALMDSGGFADGRINGEDAELAMRLGTSPGFIHVADPVMFAYRVHPGNVTMDTSKSLQGLQLLLAKEAEDFFPGGIARARERSCIISRHVRPMAMSLARRGDCVCLALYWQVLPEALRAGRFRFAAGLPLILMAGFLTKYLQKISRVITNSRSRASAPPHDLPH